MITIDATAARTQGGGIGRYTRELIRALAAQDAATPYTLFSARTATPAPPPPGPNFRHAQAPLSDRWLARLWHRARVPLPVELWAGRARLFHATDFTLPPTLPGTRTLLTVHDLSFLRAPEAASPALRRYLSAVVPRSVRAADHIVADSVATRDDLIALYHVPPAKITVLYSGVDARFTPVTDATTLSAVRARYHLPARPYLLAVGTVQPRKNYARLAAALALLRARGHGVQLVVAGGPGWLEDGIHRAVALHALQPYVTFTGFVADDDLPALYSGARALAFPSLYEGFGLPILEAFACGTPVLTAPNSSLPEVAADAALYADPHDVHAIADGLARLLDDEALRATLVARGHQRAAAFTWAQAARTLRALYADLLAAPTPARRALY